MKEFKCQVCGKTFYDYPSKKRKYCSLDCYYVHLKTLKKSNAWTEAELSSLRQLYPFASKEELLEALPERSWTSICVKAQRLKLKRNTRIKSILNYKPSEYELGYLAGLIDGEGTICISRSRSARLKNYKWTYYINVRIVNTSRELINEARRICGDMGSKVLISRKKNRKDLYVYRIPLGIVRLILPKLKLFAKKEQQDSLLKLLKVAPPYTRRTNEIDRLYEQTRLLLNELNKRGRATTTKRI